MDNLQQIHEITVLQWALAYAGSFIYIMVKIQELNDLDTFEIGKYVKKFWASTLATAAMIPVCMLILHENFADLLPVNNLTSVLVGYQTNQVFKSFMNIGGKRLNIGQEKNPVASGSSENN
jgi:hypothetical protein